MTAPDYAAPRRDDLEPQYSLRPKIPDYEGMIAGFSARSEALRADIGARMDLEYGAHPRERVDYLPCGRANAPLLFFIHGGYWRGGDKSIYSFIARPFLDHGINVAMVGYTLCPEATVASITGQIRSALGWIWRNGDDLGFDRDRLYVSGHSAGGHLTGMSLATDWPSQAADLPADLIKAAIPISGLFELAPLRHTSINDAVRMDAEMAASYSPRYLKPATGAPVLAAAGGGETDEFKRQTVDFVAEWRQHGIPITASIVSTCDHFSILEELADPDSDFFNSALKMLL